MSSGHSHPDHNSHDKAMAESEDVSHGRPEKNPGAGSVDLVGSLTEAVKLPVAREAWLFVAPLLAAMAVFWFFGNTPVFAGIGLAAGYVVVFFRDLDRETVRDADRILAPADGRVIAITRVRETAFLNEECFRVSIFMSLIDNHINRLPVKGKILYQKHKDGEWLPADHNEASERNEKNGIGIEGEKGNIYLEQVAGLIARRIVSKVEVGDILEQGDRFGLIMFGSRVDLYLPTKNITVEVSKGKHVYGGLTVIGKYND